MTKVKTEPGFILYLSLDKVSCIIAGSLKIKWRNGKCGGNGMPGYY
jgi:hypothetical protein